LGVGESAYRNTDGPLRAALTGLAQRAMEVGARVDRVYLERYELRRLARLNEQWRAVSVVTAEALDVERGNTEALVRACDAQRVLIAEIEAIVASGVDKMLVASGLERERRFEVVFAILVAATIFVCAALASLVFR
jgi:hypothetical protein